MPMITLMMRVPTTHRLFGFPAIALVFFTFAVLAGAALAVSIVLNDRKVAQTSLTAHTTQR